MNSIPAKYKISKHCYECQGIICYYDRRLIDSYSALSGLCQRCQAREDEKKKRAASFDMEKWRREYKPPSANE